MRTNTTLDKIYKGIQDMFPEQMQQEITSNEEAITSLQKEFIIKSLQEAVTHQAESLKDLRTKFPPEWFYKNHEKFEMPRFISMQPNKQTGLYHENIMSKAMDGATSLHILASAVPMVEQGKEVSFDFLDIQSVMNEAKKEPDKQNTSLKPVNSLEQVVVREVVTKDKESGLEKVEYYKTLPVRFVENGSDGTSKVQPRLYQRLGGITQDEANSMYRKAEELIVQKLAENHPKDFARLTEDQQKYKILPRYVTGDTTEHVQKAMLTKEYTHAFIAIQTHMSEAESKKSHVSFVNKKAPWKYRDIGRKDTCIRDIYGKYICEDYWYFFNVNNRQKGTTLYEIALDAQNVTEITMGIVLGKRIQQTVEAEKAQAAARNREREATKTAGTFLGAVAAVANAAVKRVKIARTRNKTANKVKKQEQGLDI